MKDKKTTQAQEGGGLTNSQLSKKYTSQYHSLYFMFICFSRYLVHLRIEKVLAKCFIFENSKFHSTTAQIFI